MSTRLSQEITECFRAGRYVLSAFETEGSRVAARFQEVTGPHVEEGAEPGPIGFLVAIESKMRAALDLLVEADFAVARAVGLESLLRQQFRADKRQLALQLVALRRMVLAQYAEPDMENLGLQPVNVRDGVTILRRGELISQRFEAENLLEMLGESRFEGPIDLSPYVAEIRAKSAALLRLSEEIDEAHRGSDRARIDKNRAREDYDRVFLRGTRMFEDMCRFVGLDDLAARVRRRQSRPAVTEETVSLPLDPPRKTVSPPLDPPRGTVSEPEAAPRSDGQDSGELAARVELNSAGEKPGVRPRPCEDDTDSSKLEAWPARDQEAAGRSMEIDSSAYGIVIIDGEETDQDRGTERPRE